MSATAGRRSALATVLSASAIAGTLDILAAFANAGRSGVGPARVLQAVASGLLGREAFRGGAGVAALGLLAHFVIATGWAALFYAASRRAPALVRRPVASGLLYGALVYWLMRLVVLPLSAANLPGPPTLLGTLVPMGIIMACIGLPVALIVARRARREGWA